MLDNSTVRVATHIITIAWLLAGAWVLVVAQGRPLTGRYWRLRVVVRLVWALWFLVLGLSVRSVAVVPRETLVWTLAWLELAGALGGWVALVLIVRASFTWRKGGNDAALFAQPSRSIGSD